MILETLRNALIVNGVTATIYIDFFPAEPDTAILLRGYAGQMPDVQHLYDRPSLQVITRSSSYVTARDTIYSIFHVLHGKTMHSNVSGLANVIDLYANQSPYFIGRDDRDRSTFTQNYRMEIVRE